MTVGRSGVGVSHGLFVVLSQGYKTRNTYWKAGLPPNIASPRGRRRGGELLGGGPPPGPLQHQARWVLHGNPAGLGVCARSPQSGAQMQLYLHCWVQVLSNDNIYSCTSKSFYQWLERNIKKTEWIAVEISDSAWSVAFSDIFL